MPRQTKAPTSSYDATPKARAFDMESLVEGGPEIEVVEGDKDIRKLAEDTKFMEEEVDIRFLDNGDPNAPRMVEIGVNTLGANGKGGKSDFKGFLRGKVYRVKRYIVEVAAHAKIVTLKQVPNPNPANPEMMNVATASYSYPFEVVRDPNPKGRAWLEARLNDPI